MGISPGVYIANFFAFTYELGFLRQLVDIIVSCPVWPDPVDDHMGPDYLQFYTDAHYAAYKGNAARYVWRCFRYTTRFVDDMDTVVNPLFQSLMHVNQSIAGGCITGVYPVATPIKAQGHPIDRVPYLDILKVYTYNWVTSTVQCTTRLYDKRRERCYEGIHVVQYTPLSAGLAQSCLYNIFTGQLHRYQRRIMDEANFRQEAAKLLHKLVALGYQQPELLRRLRRHLGRFGPQFYPHIAPHRQYKLILDDVAALTSA